MSRLPASASDPPGKAGVRARANRSRQSMPASIVPSSNNMRSTTRNPQRSRPANPAAGKPTRSRRVAASIRRRWACHSCVDCVSRGAAGRSASACNGRCSSPLSSSMRRRAAAWSGTATPRFATARATTNAAPKPSSNAACSSPGRRGKRSNKPTAKKTPSAASAGQHAGQTRSHNKAARAKRRRSENRASGSGERSVMPHLVSVPAAVPPLRATPERCPKTAYHHRSAAPG